MEMKNYHLTYRDQFRSQSAEEFQLWFEKLARAMHPIGDFTAIRKTSGDGGMDGFVISSQLVYQVFAPARRKELRDAETAKKIRADFATARATLGGDIRKWVFVHNHPEARIGKLSTAAISGIKTDAPTVEIRVLDINSLWLELAKLPEVSLMHLFGEVSSSDSAAIQRRAQLTIATRKDFIEWSVRSNCSLIIPNLGVSLPIEQAAIDHHITDTARSDSPGRVLSIHEVVSEAARLVVQGGPGVGKSTIARQLTHLWACSGLVVLKVSLRFVAMKLRQGCSFDKALWEVASDGFTAGEFGVMAEGAVHLIADGLDESGSDRANLAEHLKKWAEADNRRKVIVLTRRLGDDFGWFDGWRNVELQPLTLVDVEKFAEKVYLSTMPDDPQKATGRAAAFVEAMRKSRTASVAATNPQLLGMMIALHRQDGDINGNRYRLFQRAVEQFRDQTRSDRIFQELVDASTGYHVMELAGWHLLQDPTLSRARLLAKISAALSSELSTTRLLASKAAEQAMDFWEERGLIQRESMVGTTIVEFIHSNFRDFAAATFLDTVSDDAFVEWVTKVRGQPDKREALLFTGGTSKVNLAIRTIVNDFDPSDPIADAGLLAAEILAESEALTRNLIHLVVPALMPRLTSPVPDIAYEAGDKLYPLALANPDVIGPIALNLSSHDQAWTRQVACALALAAGEAYVNPEAFVASFRDAKATYYTSGRGSGVAIHHRPLIDRLIIQGAEFLLTKDMPTQYVAAVKDKLRSGWCSINVSAILETLLRRSGISDEELIELNPLRHSLSFLDDPVRIQAKLASRRAVMEAVLEAATRLDAGVYTLPPSSDQLVLVALLEELRIEQTPILEYWNFADRLRQSDLAEVVSGFIIALRLDAAQIRADAKQALQLSENALQALFYRTHGTQPDDDPEDSFWTQALAGNLRLERLISAMDHPVWFIAKAAASFIIHAFSRRDGKKAFQSALRDGRGHAVEIVAQVATDYFGKSSQRLILERLEHNLTDDCDPLIRLCAETATNPPALRLQAALRKALAFRNAGIVTAALEVIETLKLDDILGNDITDAYTWWIIEGPGGLERSGAVPPNAAATLLEHLVSRGKLSCADMTHALAQGQRLRRSDVIEMALPSVCLCLSKDSSRARSAISDVKCGMLPSSLIDTLSRSYPLVCKDNMDVIIDLLSANDPDVRIAGMRALGDGWAEVERVRKVLQPFFNSDDVRLRNEAADALRRANRQ
jgi:hypothetical protein